MPKRCVSCSLENQEKCPQLYLNLSIVNKIFKNISEITEKTTRKWDFQMKIMEQIIFPVTKRFSKVHIGIRNLPTDQTPKDGIPLWKLQSKTTLQQLYVQNPILETQKSSSGF